MQFKREDNGIVFHLEGESESVSFLCDLPIQSWIHFAVVVDSVTTVGIWILLDCVELYAL